MTTPTVAKLYGQTLRKKIQSLLDMDVAMLTLDCDESTKELWQVERICAAASELGLGRNAVLIAMGGGVLTDLVTMAASWIRRGIGCIRIPTTLVGQIDGGIGVKGAVNFRMKKNWLGCYRAPESVLVDPEFLASLNQDQIRHGMAEIIKMALIRDVRLFDLVEQHTVQLINTRFKEPRSEAHEIIWRSILLMLDELETNIYEDQTYQRLVDFGHTFSPIIEACSKFTIPHGAAVAIDMALSCVIARELDLLADEDCNRAIALLNNTGLQTVSPLLTLEACGQALSDAASHRGGDLNLVIPTAIGNATFVERIKDVSPATLQSALDWLKAQAHPVIPRYNGARTCLVFDVGGTSLRGAVYDPEKEEVQRVTARPTCNHRIDSRSTPAELFERLIHDMNQVADTVLNGESPSEVSVAFAGPVTDNGVVLAAPTIWGKGAEGVDVLSRLRQLWPGSKVSLLNDVTAAGYRYLRDESDDLCIVTVGSGIGNKVFVQGNPITGTAARGGELGHLRVDNSPDAVRCDCGGRGHLGGIASGRGALDLAKQYARREPQGFSISSLAKSGAAGNLTNADLVCAFHEGDTWTVSLIRTIAQSLGQVLAGVHLSVGTERFVIFGGFGLALGETYRRFLAEYAAEHSWNVGQDWNSMIELGKNDDYSGLIGAGRYATRFNRNSHNEGTPLRLSISVRQ